MNKTTSWLYESIQEKRTHWIFIGNNDFELCCFARIHGKNLIKMNPRVRNANWNVSLPRYRYDTSYRNRTICVDCMKFYHFYSEWFVIDMRIAHTHTCIRYFIPEMLHVKVIFHIQIEMDFDWCARGVCKRFVYVMYY